MTRPCEKLILVDAEYNAPGHLKKLLPSAACPAHPEAVSGCGSMGDWVLLPLLCRPEGRAAAADGGDGGARPLHRGYGALVRLCP